MTSKRIYPELIGYRHRDRKVPPPEFPDNCPCCGADVIERTPRHAIYTCGGKYEQKPQIQNHTNKWWGRCER